MRITKEYRELCALKHRQQPWGDSGHYWTRLVEHLYQPDDTILDYGAGSCTIKARCRYPVECYDPCVPAISDLPEPAHIVICTDVMEHVEPECIDDVINHIALLVVRVGLFVVHCAPAIQALPDGRNAHISVYPPAWWAEKLSKVFRVEPFPAPSPLFACLCYPQESQSHEN